MSMTAERSVHDPVAVEQKIEETKNRIAAGVRIVTGCEKELKAKKRAFDLAWSPTPHKNGEGSIKRPRRSTADIRDDRRDTGEEACDNAEIAATSTLA